MKEEKDEKKAYLSLSSSKGTKDKEENRPYTIEDTLAQFRLKASEVADDKRKCFGILQNACFTGMSAIKFKARENGGSDNGLSEEKKKELEKFIMETRIHLDKLDFDEDNVSRVYWTRLNSLVRRGFNDLDAQKVVENFFYANWIDDVGDILSDIEQKLIGLGLYGLSGVKSIGQQLKEHLAKEVQMSLEANNG